MKEAQNGKLGELTSFIYGNIAESGWTKKANISNDNWQHFCQ
ncbi:MAG: hypothetical protein ACI81Y_002269 [Glaciecola sp.]|jgi:hypothetical protein